MRRARRHNGNKSESAGAKLITRRCRATKVIFANTSSPAFFFPKDSSLAPKCARRGGEGEEGLGGFLKLVFRFCTPHHPHPPLHPFVQFTAALFVLRLVYSGGR